MLERDGTPGGKARTTVRDGYTVDWGPNGFLTNVRDAHDLALRLGLGGQLQVAAPAAARRYLFRDGGLRPLPTNPAQFLRSELLGPAAKVRAALEGVLGRAHAGEESVYRFLERHFGAASAEAFAGPMVLGITAGDARALSIDALFPTLRALEREHGSVVRGILARRRAAPRMPTTSSAGGNAAPERPPGGAGAAGGGAPAGSGSPAGSPRPSGRLTSFRDGGVQCLVDAMVRELGDRVRTGAAAERLERLPGGGYRLHVAGAAAVEADAVVLSAPTPATAELLRPHLPGVARLLTDIGYAGVRVFGLGYDRLDVPRVLDGFGFLVPRHQGVRSLGVLWTSTIFPQRAPEGKVLLRVLAGGALDPQLMELSEGDALAAVRRDLLVTMGIAAEPELVEAIAWHEAIPQYTLGHEARVKAIRDGLVALPGVVVAGNAYAGVGLNDAVRDAARAVAQLSEP